MPCFATLAQAQAEIKNTAAPTGGYDSTTSDDAFVLEALHTVSDRMATTKGYRFEPVVETRYLDSIGTHVDEFTGRLYLPAPLLAVTSISVNGTALTGSQYVLEPRGRTPYTVIRRVDGTDIGVWNTSDVWLDAISISGVWGWRKNYTADGWRKVDDLAASMTDSATTLTVADVDGVDPFGRTPRISAGAMLRITTSGASEYLEVTATDTTTNVVTVMRGVNGSTAIAHSSGDDVEVWYPEPAVVHATARWAGYLYQRRAAFNAIAIDGFTTTTFPEDMPGNVAKTLREYPVFDQVGAP